ncbi:MAG: hypothetical protein K8F52_01845 [Candidatus Scalindua rubra]|uniref:Uncharacterized protein n=1 Tax=Candidatus Scalindua brodae TaxID=237368 RepID=A0A0B0EJW6_9BACT|nr:MAG: hypothetical protein SCABRO_02848 [Candidatus Scalindua brodae]MBZ0107385.1 hypothetical protein [Candidatus Scalindua rubra]TWU32765.1 hypothetical protein S225a_17160 [Candidatus Brocadiaceae bacterium S225]
MAHIGSLYIGGKEKDGASYFSSGIAFTINNTPSFNYLFKSEDQNWEVELIKGEGNVVARSKNSLNTDDLLKSGFERINQCLDIVAVKKLGVFLLSKPELNYTLLFKKNDRTILRHYSLLDMPMSMTCDVEVRDKNGNIEPRPLPPEPSWTWAFRYYRLSQASQDIFEAYRNLFLSFEALLNAICPITNREREGTWLRRALTQISNEISFNGIVPDNIENIVEYVYEKQYKDTRCKLFHAKQNALLPHTDLNPTEVLASYEVLIRIWFHISTSKFFVPSGGGVITYGGFKLLMNKAFSKGIGFYFTHDSSLPTKADTKVSPLNKKVIKFDDCSYLGESRPGYVAFEGKAIIKNSFKTLPIHRIGCLINDKTLYNILHFTLPLQLIGADDFEINQEIRLINSTQPRTTF